MSRGRLSSLGEDGVVAPEGLDDQPLDTSVSDLEADADGTESFYSLDTASQSCNMVAQSPELVLSDRPPRKASGCSSGSGQSSSSFSSLAPGVPPLDVLRAHLTSGSPVFAKWMWGDAGLTGVVPQYTVLAETNPFRWSRSTSLQETWQALDGLVEGGQGQRPLRLVVWARTGEPNMTCVNFATTTTVAAAGGIAYELDAMVAAIDQEQELEFFEVQSLRSFQSFHADALAATLPTRSCGSFGAGTPPDGAEPGPLAQARVPERRPPENANRISHYQWLEELLQMIVEGRAKGAAEDLNQQQTATPLFVVAGACPNALAGMQAVLYCSLPQGVDFWWVKPKVEDPTSLERQTLNLHSSGKFKNAAGKSRAVYAPFAEKFAAGARDGDFAFGVDSGRAFIEDASPGPRRRMLVYFVWQESWSGLFARRKFIQGKLCYRWAEPGAPLARPSAGTQAQFFARQYRIEDGRLHIADRSEEEEVPRMLPNDSFQEMYDMRS